MFNDTLQPHFFLRQQQLLDNNDYLDDSQVFTDDKSDDSQVFNDDNNEDNQQIFDNNIDDNQNFNGDNDRNNNNIGQVSNFVFFFVVAF